MPSGPPAGAHCDILGTREMNLRFVEAFVWVARLRSFKGAAERLFTTQAAISSRISTLESEVGIRLFERDNRSVELTRQGRMLLPVAEQMLALGEQFKGIARPNGKSELAGTLRIGVIDTVTHTWLPQLLSTFSALYPRSTVELYSDITPTLREELLRGSIDCALVSEEVIEASIESRILAEHPMVWVGAPGAALPEGAEVTMTQLATLPIITFHRQSSVYKNIVKLLPREPRPKVNCFSSMSSMISLVKTGFGVAALPLPVVHAELSAGSLRLVRARPTLAPLPIVVNIRSERNSPMLDDFLATAIEVSASWTREFDALPVRDTSS